MNTLFLNTSAWDLVLDASGNIAMAANPYALAQDAASAIRTFQGEIYYNTEIGIPYPEQILGQSPPLGLMRAQFVAAALTVPEVVGAEVFFTSTANRTVEGQVQVTDGAGNTIPIGF